MANLNGNPRNLKRGGNHGNAGGGRTPDEIRQRWRKLGWKCFAEIERRDLKSATLRELLSIADIASRYGIGAQVDVKGRNVEQAPDREFDVDAFEAIIAARYPEFQEWSSEYRSNR